MGKWYVSWHVYIQSHSSSSPHTPSAGNAHTSWSHTSLSTAKLHSPAPATPIVIMPMRCKCMHGWHALWAAPSHLATSCAMTSNLTTFLMAICKQANQVTSLILVSWWRIGTHPHMSYLKMLARGNDLESLAYVHMYSSVSSLLWIPMFLNEMLHHSSIH